MLATVGDIASFVKWDHAHWAPETIWHKQTGKCGSVDYTFVDVALHMLNCLYHQMLQNKA